MSEKRCRIEKVSDNLAGGDFRQGLSASIQHLVVGYGPRRRQSCVFRRLNDKIVRLLALAGIGILEGGGAPRCLVNSSKVVQYHRHGKSGMLWKAVIQR